MTFNLNLQTGGPFDTINSIINGAANAALAFTSYNLQKKLMDRQNKFAANESALARDFAAGESALSRAQAQQMFETQHQTAVKDLRAAGLNPILAAGGGNAGSAGPAASGTAAAPSTTLDPAIATAQAAAALQNLMYNNNNTRADTALKLEQKNLQTSAMKKADAETKLIAENTPHIVENQQKQNQLLDSQNQLTLLQAAGQIEQNTALSYANYTASIQNELEQALVNILGKSGTGIASKVATPIAAGLSAGAFTRLLKPPIMKPSKYKLPQYDNDKPFQNLYNKYNRY